MKQTDETTAKVLDFLFRRGIFAWRSNVAPIPIHRNGMVVGFRSGGKSGTPDITGILPRGGRFLGIEVKTGKDRLRPAQHGFHANARRMGAAILVVKDFDDFVEQFNRVSCIDNG